MSEAGLPSAPPPPPRAFMECTTTTLLLCKRHCAFTLIHDYTGLLPSHLISIEATNFGLVENSLSFHKVSSNDRV